MNRTLATLLAVGSLALASACTTVPSSSTRSLLTRATAVQSQLHGEAEAIDTVFAAISQQADTLCTEQNIARSPEAAILQSLCAEWKPQPNQSADPAAARNTEDRGNAKTLVQQADAGTDVLVEYFQALHAVAQANDQSGAASDRVVTRLKAATGLLGGAAGPFGFLVGDGFGVAFKALMQATTARQVNRTLRAATDEGQMTLDLYALAMRETLGACEVRRPASVTTRLARRLRDLQAQESRRRAPDSTLTVAIAQAQAALQAPDRCGGALYPRVVAHLQDTTENNVRLTTPNYAGVRAYQDLAPSIAQSSATTVRQLNSIGGVTADVDGDSALIGRLERLESMRQLLAPYQAGAETLETRVTASQQWERDRLAARNRIAQNLFALADAHARFAEDVRKKGGFTLSGLLGGGEPEDEDEAAEGEGE